MSRALKVLSVGPGVSVQDMGRPGYLASGLSRGGAADRHALFEGAALLRQDPAMAALELAGMGGRFTATQDLRIALTGAPMRADIDGEPLAWNASHLLPVGAVLNIGPALQGVYGYLHLGGGIAAPEHLHARSAHLAAGIGGVLEPGTALDVGEDARGGETNRVLPAEDRFSGGTVRMVASLQTAFFSEAELQRFEATRFTRDARGNRMGVRMASDGPGFESMAGLSVLSEVITPGDIQITGDGAPYVLLAECGTTGGYPRIGSVLPCDVPIVAQAAPGTELRFRFVSLDEGRLAEHKAAERLRGLAGRVQYLVRDPRDMRDLLRYQLVSGAITGLEEHR